MPRDDRPANDRRAAQGWQSVRDEALRRIRTRIWPAGALIPHEQALADELGCARTTVNRALRDLAEAGLLERRRRAGTRVVAAPIRKATFAVPLIRDDIAQRGLVAGYRLVGRQEIVPPAAVLARLKLPAESLLLQVSALHLANSRPFCLEQRWINPAGAPGILDADLQTVSANEWLVRHAPFSHGDLWITAAMPDAEQAALLEAAAQTALVRIERTTHAGSLPITLVTVTYAPGYGLHTAL